MNRATISLGQARPVIGNEFDSGPFLPSFTDSQYVRQRQAARQALVQTYEVLRDRSAWFDDLTAQRLTETATVIRDNQFINTASNIILLVALLEAVAVGAPAYLAWAFLAYGLYVMVRAVSSQRVFGAALWTLLLVPLTSLFHRQALANSFAIMTFYFLLIGLIRSVFELSHRSGKKALGREA